MIIDQRKMVYMYIYYEDDSLKIINLINQNN